MNIDIFNNISILRFMTAGSVDDGKSTLIGRILYESNVILIDQLFELSKTKNDGMIGNDINLSLLIDGLEAEREQGITIDVAYRYFSTINRKFIIADTPGHEQYTRNMITALSTSDVAIILIDVTRVLDFKNFIDLLPQTKRHSVIIKLFDLDYVIIAINKMDLVNYDYNCFKKVKIAYLKFSKNLNFKNLYFIPISALKGDNVITLSKRTPWYLGNSLLKMLESLNIKNNINNYFYFSVQLVIRKYGNSINSFRGYMGRIEFGSVKIGDLLIVLPSKICVNISDIIIPTIGGIKRVSSAKSGQNITICIKQNIDISRGDVLIHFRDLNKINFVKKLEVDLCWFDESPISIVRKYLLKHTTNVVLTSIKNIKNILDINTLFYVKNNNKLCMNDIGQVSLVLQKKIIVDKYNIHKIMGSFILIDEITFNTVAVGMIRSFS